MFLRRALCDKGQYGKASTWPVNNGSIKSIFLALCHNMSILANDTPCIPTGDYSFMEKRTGINCGKHSIHGLGSGRVDAYRLYQLQTI
jgi:hypothetical protein